MSSPRANSDGRVADPLDPGWRSIVPHDRLAGWEPRRFEVSGGWVEGVEMGDGPPLVLLPPMPGWKEAYFALAPLLARRFRVITFDLRSRFDGVASWSALVEDVRAIVAAHVRGPVAVFGHSLGAALALEWTLAHPEQVRALTLSSGFARVFTPAGGRVTRWLEQPLVLSAMRWLPDTWSARFTRSVAARNGWVFDPHCDPALVELMRFGVRRVPIALLRQRIALAFALDARPELERVRCPSLIVAGARDTVFARESADELARGIAHAERADIEDVGHLHPASRPELLADRIGAWLGRI
jgi:pimeloyl-ACP methyl ester carboxylesterase